MARELDWNVPRVHARTSGLSGGGEGCLQSSAEPSAGVVHNSQRRAVYDAAAGVSGRYVNRVGILSRVDEYFRGIWWLGGS